MTLYDLALVCGASLYAYLVCSSARIERRLAAADRREAHRRAVLADAIARKGTATAKGFAVGEGSAANPPPVYRSGAGAAFITDADLCAYTERLVSDARHTADCWGDEKARRIIEREARAGGTDA